MAEAKGKEKVARAELDHKYSSDKVKSERKVKDMKAEATFEVAKQKCDDQKGEAKDACMKQARVDRDRAKGAAEKTADIKKENRSAAGATAPAKRTAPAEQPKQKP